MINNHIIATTPSCAGFYLYHQSDSVIVHIFHLRIGYVQGSSLQYQVVPELAMLHGVPSLLLLFLIDLIQVLIGFCLAVGLLVRLHTVQQLVIIASLPKLGTSAFFQSSTHYILAQSYEEHTHQMERSLLEPG